MKDRHPLIKASMLLALLAILSALAFLGTRGMISSWRSDRAPLGAAPPPPGPSLPSAASRRLVWILADGLRRDTAERADLMPTLASLKPRAAWGAVQAQGPSNPRSAWAVLLTGAEPFLSGAPLLDLGQGESRPLGLESIVETARRSRWKPAVAAFRPFTALVPRELAVLAPSDEDDQSADRDLLAAAMKWLSGGSQDFVIIRLGQLAWAGSREGGASSAGYEAAARRVDGAVAQVLARLDLRRDTLIISSSHGMTEAGGWGGPEPDCSLTPLLILGAGAIPGVHGRIRQIDLAPTMAALMGCALPSAAAGSPALDMIQPSPETALSLVPAEMAQKALLGEALSAAFPRGGAKPRVFLLILFILAWLMPGAWSLYTARRRDARMAHGAKARFMRNRLLLFLGALGAALASHGIYFFIMGKGYSVSSFHDMASLIRGSFEPAFYALSGVALVVILGTPSLRKRPFEAFRATIELGFWTMWDLLLPFGAFLSLYGAAASWPLPSLYAWYLALLSALMALGVVGGSLVAALLAMAGTALAGLEARREEKTPTGQVLHPSAPDAPRGESAEPTAEK